MVRVCRLIAPIATSGPVAPNGPVTGRQPIVKDKLSSRVSLSELSEITEVPSTKLEYWVKVLLLKPNARNGRSRLFDREVAVKRIRQILDYQQRGYNLQSIRDLLGEQ